MFNGTRLRMTVLLLATASILTVGGRADWTVAQAAQEYVLVGAGDIADCNTDGDEQTAALLDKIPGTVFTAGDNAYPDGRQKDFAECYQPTWGRHKSRTRPSLGNHDHHDKGAAGYFAYFGKAAGNKKRGYYSFRLGAWHIVVLNSNCSKVGGCQPGSTQEKWLRAELRRNPAPCTLAVWHHPRYSSGYHGNYQPVQGLWQALWDAGADVVLTGHDHDYERFAPMDAAGQHDPTRGLRQFVVGTGGTRRRAFRPVPAENSEVRNSDTWGVLKLTLRDRDYDWQFLPVAGQTFTDSGSSACH